MQAVRAGRSDTRSGLTQKCVSHKSTRPALTPRPWATVCAVVTEQNIMSPGVSPAADQGVPVSALLYAGHSYNNPLIYVDPDGHTPILLDGEQLVETDKSSGITNHISQTITKIDHCSTAKMDPSCQDPGKVNLERDKGFGWRFEVTGIFGTGLDVNLDFVMLGNGDLDIVITPGWETGFEGGVGFSTGPLFFRDIEDKSQLSGLSMATGGTAMLGVGGEFELASGVPYRGEDGKMKVAQSTYLGIGLGAQAGPHATFSLTGSMRDFFHFAKRNFFDGN